MTDDNRLLTPDEAVTWLAARGYPASVHLLKRWRLDGGPVQYRRIGRRVFYAEHDLIAAWPTLVGPALRSTAEERRLRRAERLKLVERA